MSPPQLARDAPVLDVLQPVTIGVFVFGRIELDLVLHHRRQGDVGKVLHFNEPLQTQPRLDRHVGTFAVADFVVVVLNLLHEVKRLQVLYNLLAAIETVHAVVLAHISLQFFLHRIHVQMRIGREDIDGLQIVFLSQRIVVHIVCRSHF